MQHHDTAYNDVPPRANTAQSLDSTFCGSEERIIGRLTTVCLVAETHVTCGRLVSTPCLIEIDVCIVIPVILCDLGINQSINQSIYLSIDSIDMCRYHVVCHQTYSFDSIEYVLN